MSRPKALMAALHDWYSPLALGSHHLARGLVTAGWDVAYISSGISPGQVFRDRDELRRRVRDFAWGGRWDLDGHLWSFVPLGPVTPHNAPVLRAKVVHHHWQRLTLPNVVGTVRAHGFGAVDLLYIDTPLQSFWLDAVDARVSVARIMDRASGFHGVAEEFLVMERDLIRSVDLVVYAARTIEGEIDSVGALRSLHLPNGVDFRHFAEADRTPPPEYASIPGPRAVYVGDIGKWFDFETVNALTGRLRDVSFVFIGPDRVARQRITPRPNVHILGSRQFVRLPAYLHNADLGLIPFDRRRFSDAVNAIHPLKLYEYMACGLPVVATRWEELESMASPAVLCDDADDWAAGVSTALNDQTGREARIEFARQADWSGRVAVLLDAVATIGSPD